MFVCFVFVVVCFCYYFLPEITCLLSGNRISTHVCQLFNPVLSSIHLRQTPRFLNYGVQQECLTESILTQNMHRSRLSKNVQKIRSSTSDRKVSWVAFRTASVGLLFSPVHTRSFLLHPPHSLVPVLMLYLTVSTV